jgi:hypothetical protein
MQPEGVNQAGGACADYEYVKHGAPSVIINDFWVILAGKRVASRIVRGIH